MAPRKPAALDHSRLARTFDRVDERSNVQEELRQDRREHRDGSQGQDRGRSPGARRDPVRGPHPFRGRARHRQDRARPGDRRSRSTPPPQRVQCTPDMLPGDITGSSILDQRKGTFEFQPGPVFCNVLLADEINRATPKTQSSLLEAMAERRVSADGVTYDLPRPFLVLATQNPIEQAGTFPLPEAQLDRFLFKMSLGYMDRGAEFDVMFANAKQLSIEDLGPVTDTKEIQKMIGLRGRHRGLRRSGLLHRRPGAGEPQRRQHRHGWFAPRHHQPAQGVARRSPRATAAATCTPTTCAPCCPTSWPTASCSIPTPCCAAKTSATCSTASPTRSSRRFRPRSSAEKVHHSFHAYRHPEVAPCAAVAHAPRRAH